MINQVVFSKMHAFDLHRCTFLVTLPRLTQRGIIMLNKVTLIDQFRNTPLYVSSICCDA